MSLDRSGPERSRKVNGFGIVFSAGLSAALAVTSCGHGRPPKAPSAGPTVDVAAAFEKAVETEQTVDSRQALDRYLDLIDRAISAPGSPHALEAVLAAADAIAGESVVGLDQLSPNTSLAYRISDGKREVMTRLEAAYARAESSGPFVRGAIAGAAYELAMHDGDPRSAGVWRGRLGCAREATVLGPLDAAPLTGVARPTPVEAPKAPLAASYPGITPFYAHVAPVKVEADECALRVHASSTVEGLRAVVVDAVVPRAEQIGVAIESTSAATAVVGGQIAVMRPFDLGGGSVERLGVSEVPAGRVRVVVRVADNGDASALRLSLFGPDGTPLEMHAPRPGEAATVAATSAAERSFALSGSSEPERGLVAAAWLAEGDGRSAEHLLESAGESLRASPYLSLLYTRAIDEADDLPDQRATERSRDAYESVLARWPRAFEAIIGHARLTGQRRGPGEGRIETLRELTDTVKTKGNPELDPMVFAFMAAVAADGDMTDLSTSLLEKVRDKIGHVPTKPPQPVTPLLHDLDALVGHRVGTERERFACEDPARDRSSLACLQAKVARGDRRGALAEIARLRELRGSPSALRSVEIAQRLALGDTAGVLRIFDTMLPAERTISVLGLLADSDPAQARTRLLENLLGAADVPGSLLSLEHVLSGDPARELEADGARLVAEDRARSQSAHAATWVLRHRESYTVGDGGVLHYLIYDLRRVLGTTDVEEGVQSEGPIVEGREVRRTLRRRIHKPDGRVLEPDSASLAAQGNADLSQLQTGDYVEQIIEGWSLPGVSGQLVVDTPDLLPERTSVADAEIEIRRPASLSLAMWSHALLGKGHERTDGTQKVTTFTLKDRMPRRLEEGVARMDRDVAVSFGTATWADVGRQIGEAIAALGDHDPFVARWAHEAIAGKGDQAGAPSRSAGTGARSTREIVDELTAAAGKSIKVASGSVLSDSAAAFTPGSQTTSARTILELGQGSRSWVVYRSLVELGIPAEIVVAEREPFSADPAYPAHLGRFDYPLVIVHSKDGDLWLDLDVPGPPLPPGRVSPELRGRLAMNEAGKMIQVGGASTDQTRDEVDIRLKVDPKGNASGTFTVLLRGRAAQQLSDAFEKVVGSDRRDLLRSVVLGWLPWANVDDVVLSSSEGSWQVSVRAAVSIPGYAQQEGSDWVLPGLEPLHAVFPRAIVSTIGSSFATQGDRQSALAIGSAFLYHLHRRVELTPKAQLKNPLPDVEVKDEHVEAIRKGTFSEGAIDENFALSIPTGTIAAEHYGDFAARAHRIDDGFLAATRVSL